ncbi:60S ribosomal L22 protein [Rutstroemia sp. NJR-2017a WRK4]|nr:60S ribosomal L22 protein [Rutstroemia sp. NJR-2017a WRK4]PQE25598.1 60S ribosomal L22 protein [Rutstroemia sp. NJR-2017a BBW]
MPPKAKTAKGKVAQKKVYTIDCKQPANDKIFDTANFQEFIQNAIKVDGLKGNFGSLVTVSREGDIVKVTTSASHSTHYMKYLTKKYLKKKQLRDWLRVVSDAHGKMELKFFNVVGEEAEDDDE